MASRDLQKEQAALAKFGEIYGKMPESSSEWSNLHKLAYAPGEMPDEFKAQQEPQGQPTSGAQALAGATDPTGVSPSQAQYSPNAFSSTQGLPQTQQGSNINQLRQNVDAANQEQKQYQDPTYALKILQDSIRKKAKMAERPIGESQIFKQAGVGGMGALGTSLAVRGREFRINQTEFRNIVKNMYGVYKETGDKTLKAYDQAVDAYEFEAKRLQGIENDLRDYEQQMQKAAKANQMAKELALYKQQVKDGNYSSESSVNYKTGRADLSIGSGVITAFGSYDENGKPVWEHGLDIQLDGMENADVISPFGGEVIFAGENGGFGNQVKIRMPNGEEVWYSHLKNIDINQDQSVEGGVILGKQGSTGKTMGATGIHVDITMKKKDGTFYTPEEVADKLGYNGGGASQDTEDKDLTDKERTKKYIKSDISAITGADGYIDTGKYQEVRAQVKREEPELLSWFDKTFSVDEYLNPEDPTAQELMY